MRGANASPTGRSHQEMTAHDPINPHLSADDRACAVIDRAYNKDLCHSMSMSPNGFAKFWLEKPDHHGEADVRWACHHGQRPHVFRN